MLIIPEFDKSGSIHGVNFLDQRVDKEKVFLRVHNDGERDENFFGDIEWF